MQLKTHQTGPEGQKVRRLLHRGRRRHPEGTTTSRVTDRATQKVAFIASSEGGMDIEEVAHATPEKIIKVFVDPLAGLTDAQARNWPRHRHPGRLAAQAWTSARSSTSATWTPTPRWWRSTR
jgi:succinyl-CoA synthetase beta subunit